jgi:hypothetical protein
MAIKTFTTGEVLTASDTNTYLANSGLVFVKSQAVGGTNVASVVVTDAFSSTYDNYKIIWSGGTQSTTTAMTLQLGSTTTDYYGLLIYGSSTTTTVTGANDDNTAVFTYAGGGDSARSYVECELLTPFATFSTQIKSYVRYGNTYGNYVGLQNTNASHTSFTLIPYVGTMKDGTVTVYGYRKG